MATKNLKRQNEKISIVVDDFETRIKTIEDGQSAQVIDAVDSFSTTDALSANQGRILATGIGAIGNSLNDYMSSNDATTNQLTNDVSDLTGRVSNVEQSNSIQDIKLVELNDAKIITENRLTQLESHYIINDLNSMSTTDSLSANQGRILGQEINAVAVDVNQYKIDNDVIVNKLVGDVDTAVTDIANIKTKNITQDIAISDINIELGLNTNIRNQLINSVGSLETRTTSVEQSLDGKVDIMQQLSEGQYLASIDDTGKLDFIPYQATPQINSYRGRYDTLADAQIAIPTPQNGYYVLVGNVSPYTEYVYDSTIPSWVEAGTSQAPIEIVDNLIETQPGKALDARQGRALASYVETLDNNERLARIDADNALQTQVNIVGNTLSVLASNLAVSVWKVGNPGTTALTFNINQNDNTFTIPAEITTAVNGSTPAAGWYVAMKMHLQTNALQKGLFYAPYNNATGGNGTFGTDPSVACTYNGTQMQINGVLSAARGLYVLDEVVLLNPSGGSVQVGTLLGVNGNPGGGSTALTATEKNTLRTAIDVYSKDEIKIRNTGVLSTAGVYDRNTDATHAPTTQEKNVISTTFGLQPTLTTTNIVFTFDDNSTLTLKGIN